MIEDKFLKWLNEQTVKSLQLGIIKDKYVEYKYPREFAVIDYIRKNKNVRKIDVMRALSKTHREMSTYETIKTLVKEGKLKLIKPKDKLWTNTDYLVIK